MSQTVKVPKVMADHQHPDHPKPGLDVMERPISRDSAETIEDRFLLFYQVERLVEFMEIKDTSPGQTLIFLSNFRAILKQVLARECNYVSDRNQMYWFEVTIVFGENENGQLNESTRYNNRESILDSKLMIRLRSVGYNYLKNDKISLRNILDIYPHLKEKMKNGDLLYSDLIHTAERMFKEFRQSYKIGQKDDNLADFLSAGKIHRLQKPISNIYQVAERFSDGDYPILVYRGAFTSSPRRILAIILLNRESVQFLVSEMISAKAHSFIKHISWVKKQLPYFDHLLLKEARKEIGRRLLLIAKNSLLVDLHTKEMLS